MVDRIITTIAQDLESGRVIAISYNTVSGAMTISDATQEIIDLATLSPTPLKAVKYGYKIIMIDSAPPE